MTHAAPPRAFTLIELLLYVAVGGVILLAASALLALVVEAREKSQVVVEVEGQGLRALALIAQNVRNAQTINSPATSTAAATLSVNLPGNASNPIVFSLASGAIQMTQGGVASGAITDAQEKVSVTALSFANLSRSGTPGTVRILFTLTGSGSASWYEYSYTKTFTGSASLRPMKP